MATSREVAEAYIEVHGDLSPFRKDLEKGGAQARAAAENMADSFGDGWNKRIKTQVSDRWEAMLDAMYSNNKLDWDKLVGKFDTTDLDRADVQIHDFMNRMREAGKLNEQQYAEVSKRVREVIKDKQNEFFVQQDLMNMTKAHGEALRDNAAFDRARAVAAQAALKVEQERVKVVDAANVTERDRADIIDGVARATRRSASANKDASDSTGIWATVTDKLKLSWARMDSTVRLVIGAILSSAGPIATLGSGIAGTLVAMAGSAAQAVGALGAMVGPALAFGAGVALAISSFDEILTRLPRVQQSLDRIANNWTKQADAFGRQWQGAIDNLLDSFASKMEAFDIGTPLGRAFAEITDGFNRVVNGPSFNAFMREMTTNFPEAVSGIGRGLAGLTDGFLALFAGAGPVAKQLGDDFARWGARIGEALEKARASGEITALFGRMRESLLAVLDLVGSVGMAIGRMLDLGSESGNRMIRSLAGIVDQFTAWSNTQAGRDAILTWFNNAERIIRSMEPLVVGLGKAMAILVTPHSIDLFAKLMGTLGELLPILAEMLTVISDLGILNILAEAMLAVGKAVQPLLPPLGQVARVLGDILIKAVEAVTPLLVAVGEALAPIAQAAADLWQQLAPTLIPAIERLAEALIPVVTKILELAAAIVTNLLPVVGPLFSEYINISVNSLVFMLEVLNSVLTFVSDVVTGLIDFFANLGTHVANFNATVNQALSDFWTGIVNGFNNFVAGFQAGWDGFWNGLATGISAIWTGIVQWFTDAWLNITTGLQNFITGFQTAWDGFWNMIGVVVQTAWNNLLTWLQGIWQGILSGVDAMLIQPWNQFWSAFWNALPTDVQNSWTNIWNTVTNFIGQVISGIQTFISNVTSAWNNFWTAVFNRVQDAWNNIMNGVNNGINQVKSFISNFVSAVQNQWNQFWTQVNNLLTQAWNRIVQSVQTGVNNLRTNISNLVSSVTSQWNSFWSSIGNFTSSAWNNIVNFVNNGINNVRNFIQSGMNAAQNAMSSAWNAIWSTASSMMNNLVNAVSNGINNAANWFAQLPGRAGAALGSMVGQLYQIGANAIQSLANAIMNGAGAVIGAITGAVGGAINAAKRMLGIASPSKVFTKFGEQTDEGYVKGVEKGETDVERAVRNMAELAMDAFNRSKAETAGVQAGLGLAKGLESSKARVQAALGKLDPNLSASYSASVSANAARMSAAPAVPAALTAGQQAAAIFNEGAVQVVTRATDPSVITGILTDKLEELVGKSNF